MHAAVTDADDEMIVVVSVVLLAKFFCEGEYGRGCRVKVFAASIRVIEVAEFVLLFRRTRSIAP